MTKLDRIIEAGEDWHINRLSDIADDLLDCASVYEQMGLKVTKDMPEQISMFIERLSRLKEQISDEVST